MAFQAGPYRWTATPKVGGAVELGVVDGPPEISVTPHYEPVRGDNMGDTIQDLIIRGHTMTLDIIFQEWNPASFFAVFPQNSGEATALNDVFTYTESIGCLSSTDEAVRINAIRMKNCPADGGAIWTFWKAMPHPDFPIRFRMGSTLRNIPMRFLLLPYFNDPNWIYYTVADS